MAWGVDPSGIGRAAHTPDTGHYRPIRAYDDRRRAYVASDPYLGQGYEIGYDDFNALWRSTNRQFLVLYPPSRQSSLAAVLAAAGWNLAAASRQALAYQQGLLNGTIPDPTPDGSPQGHELAMAWDQLQLGKYTASRRAIQQALRRGASPVAAGWISTGLALATRS